MTEAQLESVRRRLEMLDLAEALGNVSEACRRYGISRTRFYEYKRRFEEQGIEGLEDRPPVHKSHPMATRKEVKEKIVAMSISQPDWGCDRLARHLKSEGFDVSAPTVQKVLNRKGLKTRHDRRLKWEEGIRERWLELEEKIVGEKIPPSDEVVAVIEQENPCFRERHEKPSRPGKLLVQGVFLGGKISGSAPVHLHAVVDTYCSYAFCYPSRSEGAHAAMEVLQRLVLPFYDGERLDLGTMVADSGFKGFRHIDYYNLLRGYNIPHREQNPNRPPNGFMERFRRTVSEEFLGQGLRDALDLAALGRELAEWLVYYNAGRPHEGYPNMGSSPKERIDEYLRGVRGGR